MPYRLGFEESTSFWTDREDILFEEFRTETEK